MSEYSALLSRTRLRPSSVHGRSIVTEAESDRGRVLFCAAFRRLQQKAQVFSMEPNAAVRSRLTHSLEVSQIGRYIANEIGRRLTSTGKATEEEHSAMVTFVETACLMHDIGNPPFGHFGEEAIKKWFTDNGEDCLRAAGCLDSRNVEAIDPRFSRALCDFKEFDGNPQGLRVVARLQWNTDEFGLNLTKTTLASFLKYIRPVGAKETGLFTKKPGYFTTEDDIVKSVWNEFGYSPPRRFPLAYVMEAADDIAYCVSDLEDSFEKGLLHEPTALRELESQFSELKFPDDGKCFEELKAIVQAVRTGKNEAGREFTYTDFRTSLNRIIVGYAVNRYVSAHTAVLNGSLDTLLPKSGPAGAVLELLKTYCRQHVYSHESIQRIELAGYTAIKGLLEYYKPLLTVPRERFVAALANERRDPSGAPIVIENKLLSLFPEKYIKVYQRYTADMGNDEDARIAEWNARSHLIVDFVSGMTDDFAMTTYRTLAGMRL